MTFWEQVLATVVGFIFAVFLFYATEWIRQQFIKWNLIKNLKREFQYNIYLLGGWLEKTEKILRKITTSDEQVFDYLRYSEFHRLFLQECFRFGILYKSLNDEDISTLNNILIHFDVNRENVVNKIIEHWRNKVMPQKDALGWIEFERDEITKYKKELEKLSEKLK